MVGFGYMIDFAGKAFAFSQYITYWTRKHEVRNRAVEITMFFIVPILVNILNVRKYGEVEFWLTTIKVAAIVAVIIVGFVIGAGGGPEQKLGTDATYHAVACTDNVIGECLTGPGFGCMNLHDEY